MERSEMRDLLRYAAALDPRVPAGDENVEAWLNATGPIDHQVARMAVDAHYRTSDVQLMPVHLINGARAIRNQAFNQLPANLVENTPDDPAELAAYRRRRRAAVDEALGLRPSPAALEG